MRSQLTVFRRLRSDAPEHFAAGLTIRFATNHSCKPPAQICSPSCTRTETALLITCDDFITSRWIWVGSPGPSSPSEHGPKYKVKVRERSRQKNTEPSSLRKRIPKDAPITNCS